MSSQHPVVGTRTFAGVFRPYIPRSTRGVLWLLITNALGAWIPRLLNEGVERLRTGDAWRAMVPWAVTMAVAACVMAVTRILSRMDLFSVGRDIEYDLRRDLFGVLSLQPPSFFQERPVGDLMSRATNDLTNVRLLFGFAALNIINTLMVFGLNLPLMFSLDPALALASLAPYPFVFISVRLVARRIFETTKKNQEDLSAVSSRLQEHLAGLSVVRAFAREPDEVQRFSVVNQNYYGSSVKLAMTRNMLGPIMGLLATSTTLIALWFGATRVMAGQLGVGALVEFTGRLAALAWPTLALGWIVAVWQRGRASFDRINELMVVEPTIASPPSPTPITDEAGRVEVRNVSVVRRKNAKDETGTTTVKDVSFTVPARGFVGIAGATGSGKSTVAHLLPRLLDATSGSVLIDGVDVRQWDLRRLRCDVAIAPQEPFLFSASVLDNLRFGRPDATRDEVDAMVKLLALEQDIASFPQGLDTVIGERGITLSGGQRQRVALGRALLCQPRVLVLDDTMSALDAETEERILAMLRGEAHKRTLVVVTHRLSVLRDADEVLVLDQGAIIERGTHSELLAREGAYARLWGREKAREQLAKLDAPAAGASA